MRMILLTASLLAGLSPMCMAGQVYKWVDAQGVTHFGSQPPQGAEATTVIKSAPSPAGKPPAPPTGGAIGDQKVIDQEVKKQVAEQEAQLKAFCEQARTNLAQLQNNPRLREEVEGEIRRLTDEERRQRIDETRQQIEEHCQ
ncbi:MULTISPECIES: DUF4124 domain-containing protein [Pseudomonas]|uniref:DUF4124 domain-containing protein n=1 Tax=Pseudomonas TaxID=286 RepID=UPI0008771F05|nr:MULTISPECIES: DUF4124 domain-containing protein [Pseudomonas]MDB6446717.1 DUF4124 domain-containing protein [Pseudomonas sp. 21TX0197]MDT8909039.1 DUF4124 domain-containing protein [Pseudomonas prosekii]NHN66537.1 DUF4124 domain-containing protein [Pseudomonas fluorescens]ROO34957.1 glycosyltransferase [Pseudomonas sp. AF76]ROO35239.1 glycosyltransferase [Pseudomonas sp. 7SR1]